MISEWIKHDGKKCPVDPDILVVFPAGTYYAPKGYLGPHRAGDVEWEDNKISHVRDEIQHYAIFNGENE